ncbi:telomerase reverse transcriptase [Nematostella vectensis]|uniref:telomerase reverse transcriptase n=1 Tax=Nematostella vectensis TaxID=45351 RepID=UPI00207768C2|nr:telomerase reverse transcriptase [Nematostella vectensis]
MASVLKYFYPKRYSLEEFLYQCDESFKGTLMQEEDYNMGYPRYKSIIESIMVCVQDDQKLPWQKHVLSRTVNFTLPELLNQVITVSCEQNGQSILALGYRSVGQQEVNFARLHTVKLWNYNTIMGMYYRRSFVLLHQRIGDDLMIFLLRDASMFMKTPENNCYIQVSGRVLNELSMENRITKQSYSVSQSAVNIANVTKQVSTGSENAQTLSVSGDDTVTVRKATKETVEPQSDSQNAPNTSSKVSRQVLKDSLNTSFQSLLEIGVTIRKDKEQPLTQSQSDSDRVVTTSAKVSKSSSSIDEDEIVITFVKPPEQTKELLSLQALTKRLGQKKDLVKATNLCSGRSSDVNKKRAHKRKGNHSNKDFPPLKRLRQMDWDVADSRAEMPQHPHKRQCTEVLSSKCSTNKEPDSRQSVIGRCSTSKVKGRFSKRKRRMCANRCFPPSKRHKTLRNRTLKVANLQVISKHTSSKIDNQCSKASSKCFSRNKLWFTSNLGNTLPKKYLLSKLSPSNRGAEKVLIDIFFKGKKTTKRVPTTKVVTENRKAAAKKDKEKPVRLPRRFIRMKPLFVRLLKRHKNCNFKALLSHHCRFTKFPSGNEQVGGNVYHDAVKKLVENGTDKGKMSFHDLSDTTMDLDSNDQENITVLVEIQGQSDKCSDNFPSPVNVGKSEDLESSCRVGKISKNVGGGDKNSLNTIQNSDRRSRENDQKGDFVPDGLPCDGEDELESQRYQHAVRSFTPYSQVFLFVKAVCNKVIPYELWGSSDNKHAFFRNLKKFISLRKPENMTLAQMARGMKVKHCKWLHGKEGHPSTTESRKRMELLMQWLWWLMESYLMVVIRAFFYVTEGTTSTKMFYYRVPVWRVIHDFGMNSMKDIILKPLSKEEAKAALAKSTLGCSYMRFLPKALSVRPIINLKGKSDGGKSSMSINSKLKNLFLIIKHERTKAKPSGSGMLGFDDVFRALSKFISGRNLRNDERPLYFVRVDVAKCFDSILHVKLHSIMKHVLTHQLYTVRRFVIMKRRGLQSRRMYKKYISYSLDRTGFVEFAKEYVKESELSEAVLVDQVRYFHEHRDESLLPLLEEHIFRNLVNIHGKVYWQTAGIPQGSIMSSIFCCYYYDAMESSYFPDILRDDSSLMMRWVDDFILITPHRETAESFLAAMHAGIPEFGCKVNKLKTLTNYVSSLDGGKPVNHIEEGGLFPWCGILIDPATLNVQMDLKRYIDGVEDSIQGPMASHTGHGISTKLKFSLRAKCVPLLLSSQINSQTTVLVNIYQMFFLTACKFLCLCKGLPKGHRSSEKPRFFTRIILALPSFLVTQTRRKCTKEHAPCHLRNDVITWLCCQAFVRCLGRKLRYSKVVKLLRYRQRRVRLADPRLPLPLLRDPFPIPRG